MARILSLLALLLVMSAANARPAALLFCHEDQDSFPWVLRDKPGLNILLIKLLERDIGRPVTFVPLPWKRCLAELAAGKFDGAFASSFKVDRLQMGHYPVTDDGKPAAAKRLHMSSYSLYRTKGGDLGWNGQRFQNLRGPIGTLSAHSVVDFLKERGVTVDEGTKSPEDTLRKVALGRLQGAALQTPRAEWLLQQHPDIARNIERAPILLEERPYYLMLSFKFVAQEPQLAATIWTQIARIRESDEYKWIEHEFYSAN